MIDNVVNDVGQALGKTPLPPPDPANMRPSSDSDATIQMQFADILNRAREADETDNDAVEKARELLLSGRLTSPENVRGTAESIVNFGI
ncbi:MAG: hypothetical protein JW955_01330 [Sedimentisphaerales bacterium]|nr:hypothetical protein [Sedimentisphaerales bacterium]